MSLDLFLWLSGSVELPRDLPGQAEWQHFEGYDSWQIDRGNYSIRASRMDSADVLGDAAGFEEELANKVKNSKARISLILEGSYEAGYLEQAEIAEHLAKRCGGAILEGPPGYNEIDELGRWK